MRNEPEFYVDGKPAKVVYANGGQTKITLIGSWFFMTPEEAAANYEERLEAGDPICCRINNVACSIFENSESAG